jgi:tellurite resistance protein
MEALLEKRPSDEYLDESLEVLKEVLEREKRPEHTKTVLGLCILVAEAAGGLLGLFNPVSKQERDVIELIAKRLGDDAVEEFHRRLG